MAQNPTLCSNCITITTLLVIALSASAGRSNMSCDIQPCFTIYNNLRSLFSHSGIDQSEFGDEAVGGYGMNIALLECSLRKNLTHCMKREEKRCRGDLNYHSLGGLINRLRKQQYRENCSSAAVHHHDRSSSGSIENTKHRSFEERPILPSTVRHSTSSPSSITTTNTFSHRRRNGHDGGRNNNQNNNNGGSSASREDTGSMKLSDILLSKAGRNRLLSSSEEDEADEEGDDGDDWDLDDDDENEDGELMTDKCVPKSISQQQRTVGCALYGLTNLKSFHDPLNFTDFRHCSLTGSWSLIDTPEFAVQITNKEGYPPMPKDITMTTLVTVILKNNDCSQRKTYQATYDEVPGMFTDGSSTAGTVRIETIVPSEHVRINMHYFLSTIDIVKVVGQLPIPSLSITIKMPQVNVTSLTRDPSQINGLPLCFYGCPKVANLLNIKPRSISSYKCNPSSKKKSRSSSSDHHHNVQNDQASAEEEIESLDTTTSINAAICDSLLTVQSILGDKTIILKDKLSFPGEEINNYATLNDEGGKHGQQLSSSSARSSMNSGGNSRLLLKFNWIISQNIIYNYYYYFSNLFLYSSLFSLLILLNT